MTIDEVEEVLGRATLGSNRLLERHADQTVAIFSHGGMILTTLVHLLGLGPSGFAVLIGGRQTAIIEVIVEDGHARLQRLNDYAHLELALAI